jgi:2-oxoglutarate dehydrogenase E1 component
VKRARYARAQRGGFARHGPAPKRHAAEQAALVSNALALSVRGELRRTKK